MRFELSYITASVQKQLLAAVAIVESRHSLSARIFGIVMVSQAARSISTMLHFTPARQCRYPAVHSTSEHWPPTTSARCRSAQKVDGNLVDGRMRARTATFTAERDTNNGSCFTYEYLTSSMYHDCSYDLGFPHDRRRRGSFATPQTLTCESACKRPTRHISDTTAFGNLSTAQNSILRKSYCKRGKE